MHASGGFELEVDVRLRIVIFDQDVAWSNSVNVVPPEVGCTPELLCLIMFRNRKELPLANALADHSVLGQKCIRCIAGRRHRDSNVGGK